MIISYEDEVEPEAMLDIFPSDIFADCGSDGNCDEDEVVNGIFDSGTCIANDYSGSKEDCCKHNGCWDYRNICLQVLI